LKIQIINPSTLTSQQTATTTQSTSDTNVLAAARSKKSAQEVRNLCIYLLWL